MTGLGALSAALAVCAAASNAVASVLQRKANREVASSETGALRSIWELFHHGTWLGGFAAVLASFGFQAGALATGALALVQPLLALELPLTLLLASRVFARRLGRGDWADIMLMTGGLALLLTALLPRGGDPLRPSGLSWLLCTGSAAALIFVLAGMARAASGNRRATLLGLASGMSFALTAVFLSAALATGLADAFSRWQTYAVALSGLMAMYLLQRALQAGSLVTVQPGVTLVDPVVAIVLGVLLLGEKVRTGGWLAAAVLGMAAIAYGTVRLAHSPLVADGAGVDQTDDPDSRDPGSRGAPTRTGTTVSAAAAAPMQAASA